MSKKNLIFMAIIAICIISIILLVYLKNKNNNYNLLENENFVYMENENNTLVSTNEVVEEPKIYIHIIGEVQNPGLIVVNKGARIDDAIKKAGGITQLADLTKINLAYELCDGQKIKIPSVTDKIDDEFITNGCGNNIIDDNSYKNGNNIKVNINTASQTELETLEGIGPSIANSIIQYRKKNGRFKNINELKNVPGIGDLKYEKIKEFVYID